MRLFLIASTSLHLETNDFLSNKNLDWKRSTSSNADEIVEFSGRVCYMSFGPRQSPRNNREYIKNLISQGHESVLEHANFTILADGISRSLGQQLTRHRAGFSFSQLSQQYYPSDQIEQIPPPAIDQVPEARKAWTEAIEASRDAYSKITKLLETSRYAEVLSAKERQRAIRSAARSVLPNSTSTTLVITANARAWRNLLRVRGTIDGDMEMTEFCAAAYNLLAHKAPSCFQDFSVTSSGLSLQVSQDANDKDV